MDITLDRFDTLLSILKEYNKPLLALSGGVDSSFLAYALKQSGNPNAAAVTISSILTADDEIKRAKEYTSSIKLPHHIIELGDSVLNSIKTNPVKRCYYCKTNIFSKILEFAKKNGYETILEGTNADDTSTYRPGYKAIQELKIKSPLKDVVMSKNEIRDLSKRFSLPFAELPSFSCLATRFPYNEELHVENINRVAKAEEFIRDLGVTTLRVRSHNNIARIESDQTGITTLIDKRKQISDTLKTLGFDYITVDLEGFRSGSMDIHIS